MASTTTEPKVDVKQAAASAVDYLLALIPTIPPNDVSLEEVELDGRHWRVTLGFTDKHPARGFAAEMMAVGKNRIYKEFKIDAVTGRAASMRIRKP